MNDPLPRVYLDNAATSWPKPDVVYEAVERYQREVGAAAGRGAYRSANEAQQVVERARRACARLFSIDHPNQLVLASNGTDALNLAIHGLLRPGDHVVSTVCEHNSVLRPLADEAEHRDVQVSLAPCDLTGLVDPGEVRRLFQRNTRLVVVTHASNVTGTIQPIEQLAQLAHEHNALLLVDAAQTAGCLPLDLAASGADLVASGGHKGLLGPLGTGLLYVRPGLEGSLRPVRQGGTGVDSRSPHQPDAMPFRFEAGNLNIPALAGLGAAAEFLRDRVAEIHRHVMQLTAQLLGGLESIPGVRVIGPTAAQPRVGVVSLLVEGYDPPEFAAALDAAGRVECRAGLHCAPRIHEYLGTEGPGGTVRLSPGWATTPHEVGVALETIAALAAAAEVG